MPREVTPEIERLVQEWVDQHVHVAEPYSPRPYVPPQPPRKLTEREMEDWIDANMRFTQREGEREELVIGFTFQGADTLTEGQRQVVADYLNRWIEIVFRDAQAMCPVDTGRMRRTAFIEYCDTDDLTVGIRYVQFYAVFVHYGHHLRNDAWWPGIPWLQDAFDAHIDEVMPEVAKLLQEHDEEIAPSEEEEGPPEGRQTFTRWQKFKEWVSRWWQPAKRPYKGRYTPFWGPPEPYPEWDEDEED